MRIQAHCLRDQSQGGCGISEVRLAQCGMSQNIRIVRIQFNCAFDVPCCLLKLAAINKDPAQYELDERVAIIESGCPSGVFKSQPFLVVPEFPCLATPLIEMRQGNSRIP